MNVLIIQPPLVQLNTAYPSGAYLSAFFKSQGCSVKWADLSIKFFHKIFSAEGLSKLFSLTQEKALAMAEEARKKGDQGTYSNIISYLSQSGSWVKWIENIKLILQDGCTSSSREICHRFIFSPDSPCGMRMNNYLEQLDHAPSTDDANFLASMALADLADYITAVLDPQFSLIRYAESITVNETSFSEIEKGADTVLLNCFYKDVLNDLISELPENFFSTSEKNLVCISVPFAGTFAAALYTGKFFKQKFSSNVFVTAGGGFINTELRECQEADLGNYFDALSYDRGYGSYKVLVETINKAQTLEAGKNSLTESPVFKLRLFHNKKVYEPLEQNQDLQQFEDETTKCLIPDFSDIDFSLYPRMIDDTNPMQRMWSDGTWLKAYLAHGCYWHRCAFCDTTLDYVKSYKLTKTKELFYGLKAQCDSHKIYGIHFVDEALPPKALAEFSLLNAENENKLSFWGNVRFEKTYSRDLADLLSYGGLMGVSGGIEIATGSGLNQINKGTDLNSIVSACCAFKEAGILVHAYMIYGYWQQNDQDTINSMETLRQFYAAGLLDSSFWHKFVLTRHSGIYSDWKNGKYPDLKPVESKNAGIFAKNGLHFEGENKSSKFGNGLNFALQNWMHGNGLNKPVGKWFDFKTPLPSIAPDLIENAISLYEKKRDQQFAQNVDIEKVLWLGGKLIVCGNKLLWNYKGELEEEKISPELNGSLKEFCTALWSTAPEIHDNKALNSFVQKNPQYRKLLQKLRGKGLCSL